jgi:hypothetical protein
MTESNFTEYLTMAIVVGPIAVYMAARLITAAYFKSKQQYERQSNVNSK